MYYNAIHARGLADNKCQVVAHAFADAPGEPAQELVRLWLEMRNNPDIGKTFSTVQRVLDNNISETLHLRHPDEAAKEQERLRAGEAEREAARRKSAVLEIRRTLRERGLSVLDLSDESPAVPARDQPEESVTGAAPPGVEPRESQSPDYPRGPRLSKKTSAPS